MSDRRRSRWIRFFPGAEVLGDLARPRWQWPWLHWCVFDRECRFFGAPARLYVWPLRLMITFREEPFNIPFIPARSEEAEKWREEVKRRNPSE